MVCCPFPGLQHMHWIDIDDPSRRDAQRPDQRRRVESAQDEVPAVTVALHRAAFGAADMTVEWRKRTLCMPQYIPELDVVAVAPDGRLAAFCICWLGPRIGEGYIEPLGVHPDFAGLGLGRAVLLEGLWRLQAHGAMTALIDRYEGDESARVLYESLGFRTHVRTVTYMRCFRNV